MEQPCKGAMGQLTELWDKELLTRLKQAGGTVYSNVAVGYNNVDVAAATSLGILVGNTPGVLTDATAELTLALTFAVARHIAQADAYVREGKFKSWQSTLFLGDHLRRKTLGIIGAGRIGSAFARIMIEGHRMNLIYHNPHRNKPLEEVVIAFNDFLKTVGELPVHCRYAETVDEVLQESDIVSLHPPLNTSTHHLIDSRRLNLMKKNAILINVSRGPVVDEQALVEHCLKYPEFRAGLDVFEHEPKLAGGLKELPNVVLLPHIGSATNWARKAMATIAARNVAAVVSGYPVWKEKEMLLFLDEDAPLAAPSIVNAGELGR
jgi:glycerate dehydrogenase